MTPEDAMQVGGQPAHWANQCLLLLEPFVAYLRLVRDTNEMHPQDASGRQHTAYYQARTFYGDNGTLGWISSRLPEYTTSELSRVCMLHTGDCK